MYPLDPAQALLPVPANPAPARNPYHPAPRSRRILDCAVCGQPADFLPSCDAVRIICTRCVATGTGKFPKIEQDEFLATSTL